MKVQEGYIPFDGYQTYYRIVGENEPGRLPLLTLHGGPGCAHNYLESLDGIAERYGRQVIYYDQSGCGKSVTPERRDAWSPAFFERELGEVRRALGLERIHLLGQSWGGMLAMQYATHRPGGLASLIVASSPASSPTWAREAKRLCSYLPTDMQEALAQAARDGNWDAPAAVAASDEFYRRHVCKLNPYPAFVSASFDQMGAVYDEMWGPSEFAFTGTLKDWDVTDQLPRITAPTLVTSGQLDEATPLVVKPELDLIPNVRWALIEGGTHLCHVEYADEYNALVEDFMEAHE